MSCFWWAAWVEMGRLTFMFLTTCFTSFAVSVQFRRNWALQERDWRGTGG